MCWAGRSRTRLWGQAQQTDTCAAAAGRHPAHDARERLPRHRGQPPPAHATRTQTPINSRWRARPRRIRRRSHRPHALASSPPAQAPAARSGIILSDARAGPASRLPPPPTHAQVWARGATGRQLLHTWPDTAETAATIHHLTTEAATPCRRGDASKARPRFPACVCKRTHIPRAM